MMHLVIFMLACYSMSSIIIDQKIFEEAREWVAVCSTEHPNFWTKKLCAFIRCYFCTGFWAGVIIVSFLINPFNITILDPLLGGLVGALSSYYLHIMFSFIEKKAETYGIEI
jgi:hypothetical protein